MARILTDSQTAPATSGDAQSGLLQLVGGESNARSDRVRGFVVDTALGAIAEAFMLDGVGLVAQAPPTPASPEGRPETAASFVAARLPSDWSKDSSDLFEIYGNLWHVLRVESTASGSSIAQQGLAAGADDPPRSAPSEPAAARPASPTTPGSSPAGGTAVGDAADGKPWSDLRQWKLNGGEQWATILRLGRDDQPVAVVAVRRSPFSTAEVEAFGEVIGSVVAACSGDEASALARGRIRVGTTASLKLEGDDVLAEVRAVWDLETGQSSASDGTNGAVAGGAAAGRATAGRRTGLGRGPDPVTAVARAAAKACRPRCEVTFAGRSELEDEDVAIVMIRHPELGLRLGYAVGDKGHHVAAAEAVFTAAH